MMINKMWDFGGLVLVTFWSKFSYKTQWLASGEWSYPLNSGPTSVAGHAMQMFNLKYLQAVPQDFKHEQLAWKIEPVIWLSCLVIYQWPGIIFSAKISVFAYSSACYLLFSRNDGLLPLKYAEKLFSSKLRKQRVLP